MKYYSPKNDCVGSYRRPTGPTIDSGFCNTERLGVLYCCSSLDGILIHRLFFPNIFLIIDFQFIGSYLHIYTWVVCSRLRDSGKEQNGKTSAKNVWVWVETRRILPLFPRSRESYFRVRFLIFVPFLLSESLGQANTWVERGNAKITPELQQGPQDF